MAMKGDRVKEVTMEITVGAFIFMVLLALGIFTIVISQRSIFKKTYEYDVTFSDVAGLRDGENVYSRGMQIGSVKETEFLEQGEGVRVRLELDKPVNLRDDYQVRVTDSSLLGGKQVVLDEGTNAGQPVLKEAYNSLVGEEPKDIMEEALGTVSYIRETFEESKILDNIERLTEELAITAQALNDGTGTVARLLHDDTIIRNAEASLDNLQTITTKIKEGEGLAGQLLSTESRLLTSIESTLGNLDTISTRLERGEGLAGQLLSPESTLSTEFEDTVRKLNETITKANETVGVLHNVALKIERGEGLLGKLLTEDDGFYTDLRTTTANLAAASGTISGLATSIQAGEGTIGKLMTDDSLYNNLNETSTQLREVASQVTNGEGSLAKLINDDTLYTSATELVDEARATVDDLRETSPITTFSSIFFGAF